MFSELGLRDSYFVVTYVDRVNIQTKVKNTLKIVNLKMDFWGTYLGETLLKSEHKISFTPIISNGYWKDKVDKITVLNNYCIGNFFITTLLYKISLDATAIFLKKENDVDEIRHNTILIGSLLYGTFPDLRNVNLSLSAIKHENINTLPLLFEGNSEHFSRFDHNNIFSFLLFRPERESNKVIHGTRENVITFLKKFEALAREKNQTTDNVYIPYFSFEYIEAFFSQFQFGGEFTRILIGNSYPKETNLNYIEHGVSVLLETDIWLFVLKQTCSKIESEPIYKESIKSFTTSLIDRANNLQIIKKYYRENHLRISSDLYNFELLLDEFKNHLDSTAIYFGTNNNYVHELKEFLKGDISKFYSWSYISNLIQQQKDVKSKLEELMEHLRKRSTIINENLNSFYLMQATDINIKLQKQMKMITWIAIVIALIAIISTLFATELHDLFVSLLK